MFAHDGCFLNDRDHGILRALVRPSSTHRKERRQPPHLIKRVREKLCHQRPCFRILFFVENAYQLSSLSFYSNMLRTAQHPPHNTAKRHSAHIPVLRPYHVSPSI